MGYYTISIYYASKDMTKIDTKFGKFRYNRLPMGMCASGDISKSKIDELLDDLEGVNSYINDIIILGKDSFETRI